MSADPTAPPTDPIDPPPPPPGPTGSPLSPPVQTTPVQSAPNDTFSDINVVIGIQGFNLKEETASLLSGTSGVLGRDGFYQDFGAKANREIYDTIGKYWRTAGLTAYSPSLSAPDGHVGGKFLYPCSEKEVKLLKIGFNTYFEYLNHSIKKSGDSTYKQALIGQHSYIKRYLDRLNEWQKGSSDCINESDVGLKTSLLYYQIIPKLFYMLYKKSKTNENIKMENICQEFPWLRSDARVYIEKLLNPNNIAGSPEKQPGAYYIAEGIVEIFYMLPKIFPDKYGKLIPDKKSVEDLAASLSTAQGSTSSPIDEDPKVISDSIDEFLNGLNWDSTTFDDTQKANIKDHIKTAYTAYVKTKHQGGSIHTGGSSEYDMLLDTLSENASWQNQFEGSVETTPSATLKAKRGGAIPSPHNLSPMIAEQMAWQEMNDARNNLEPKYQSLLPEPDEAPISSLVEPFNKYIDENADPEDLQEARTAVKMMSPEDSEAALKEEDDEPIRRLTPYYAKALPRVGHAWIPIMVRADMLRTLLDSQE